MKRKLLSLALALALCLSLFPAALAEGEASMTYDEAVAELRNEDMYTIYDTIDTELCTVFLYRRIGTPHIQPSRMDILYKNGAVVRSDLSPEKIQLSGDGKELICTNPFDPSQGTNVYTVDLTSGEIIGKECILPTQEQLFGWFLEHNTEERRLEGAEDTVLLFSSDPSYWVGREKEYFLYLICREPSRRADPKGWFRRLILPSTTEGGGQYPTDRAPDEMFLSEDGSVLIYIYRFNDTLSNANGVLLHQAGTYTYTVELATGELSVSHSDEVPTPPAAPGAGGFADVAPSDWFAPYVDVCVEAGLMNGVGGQRFDPHGTVTLAQAATLAARIHHIKNGGDGNLPHAPEDYGVLTVTFENGQSLTFDSTSYRLHPVPMSAVFGADVSSEQLATLDWMNEEGDTSATITAGLNETIGPLPCRAYWNGPKENGWLRLRPRLDASDEERSTFNGTTSNLSILRRPLPGDWYRDTVYYLEGILGASETHTVTGQWKWDEDGSAGAATRGDFVEALHATSADLLAPKLNDISDFPDAGTEYDAKKLADMVLDFYNAGVMTGKDNKGTFDGDGTLTRAEAAAICARILKPELRVKFQPEPVPEKSEV